jgi:hypothetical protein
MAEGFSSVAAIEDLQNIALEAREKADSIFPEESRVTIVSGAPDQSLVFHNPTQVTRRKS